MRGYPAGLRALSKAMVPVLDENGCITGWAVQVVGLAAPNVDVEVTPAQNGVVMVQLIPVHDLATGPLDDAVFVWEAGQDAADVTALDADYVYVKWVA